MASVDDDTSFLPPLSGLIGTTNIENAGSWENLHQMKPVLYYIPPLLTFYFLTLSILKCKTNWKGLKLARLAGQFSMYPAFLVLTVTSHGATFDTLFWGWSNHQGRFNDSDIWCDTFANFYVAVNIVQAIGQIRTERPPLLYQLMAHHVLSILCYTSGFYFDRFKWWSAFAGCCEITNLFLVPLSASKDYFPEWRKEGWYLWDTRLLWLTFVTHRLVLFPCWLGLWVSDRWQAATTPDGDGENAETFHLMEGLLYPITILGLFILSTIWFRMISHVLKKQQSIYLEGKQKAISNGKKEK